MDINVKIKMKYYKKWGDVMENIFEFSNDVKEQNWILKNNKIIQKDSEILLKDIEDIVIKVKSNSMFNGMIMVYTSKRLHKLYYNNKQKDEIIKTVNYIKWYNSDKTKKNIFDIEKEINELQLKKAIIKDMINTNKVQINELSNILDEKESILSMIDGIEEQGKALIICTEKRVLIISKLLSKEITVRDIPLKSINSIDRSKSFFSASLAITDGAVTRIVKSISNEVIDSFVDVVKKQMKSLDEIEKKFIEGNVDSISKKILEIKLLLDQGLISEDEFIRLKNNILNTIL